MPLVGLWLHQRLAFAREALFPEQLPTLSSAPLNSGVAVLTGGTGVFGRGILSGLAEAGFDVVVACRPTHEASCEALISDVREAASPAMGARHFFIEPVDLASAASVLHFVSRVKAAHGPRLRVLINNAAMGSYSLRTETVDGTEAMFAVNVFAGFMLTRGFLHELQVNAPASVVFVASSAGDQAVCVDTNDLQFVKRPYHKQCAYAQTKAATRMLAWHLAQEYPVNATGVSFNAVNPGNRWSNLKVVREEPGHLTLPGQALLAAFTLFLCCDTVSYVAQRIVWLAAHAPTLGISGSYWSMVTTLLIRRSVHVPRLWTAQDGVIVWAYCEHLLASLDRFSEVLRGSGRRGRAFVVRLWENEVFELKSISDAKWGGGTGCPVLRVSCNEGIPRKENKTLKKVGPVC